MATRTQGQRLTKAQKAELGPQAVAMNARGIYYSDIAEELDVNWKTVGKLIDDELAATAEHRVNDREKHLSVIRQAQKAAWEVFDNADYRSQNKVSSLNAILAGEAQASRLTGAEAPKKFSDESPPRRFTLSLGDREIEVVDGIDSAEYAE